TNPEKFPLCAWMLVTTGVALWSTITHGGKLPVSNPPFWIIPLSHGVAVAVGVGVPIGVAVAVEVGVGVVHGRNVAVRVRHCRCRQGRVNWRGGRCPPLVSQEYRVNAVSSCFTPDHQLTVVGS